MDKHHIKRLQEIRSEMCDLLQEAEDILRCHGDRHENERAKAYWIGYMHNALGGDFSRYIGDTPSFADTIRANGGLVDEECGECGEPPEDCNCADDAGDRTGVELPRDLAPFEALLANYDDEDEASEAIG